MNIGNHIIADLYGISDEIFKKISKINHDDFDIYIQNSITNNNMNLISKNIYHFSDDGAFTSLYLLSESHISFHTWPENKYIAIDAFTCGTCDVNNLIKEIIFYLNPEKVNKIKIERGNINSFNNNIEKYFT